MSEMKIEAERNGEKFDLSETEARELFEMMQEEFSSIVDGSNGDGNNDGVATSHVHPLAKEVDVVDRYEKFLSTLEIEDNNPEERLDLSEAEIEKLFQSIREDIEEGDDFESLSTVKDTNQQGFLGFDSTADSDNLFSASNNVDEGSILSIETAVSNVVEIPGEGFSTSGLNSTTDLKPEVYNQRLSKLEELQAALPGMPMGRLDKIVTAFEETLGSPSILTLVPLLRESMPNYITSGWLKNTNRRNAEFVLQKANEDGLVDSSLLNAMLEVITSAGSINDALEFHATEFDKYNLVSDREIVLMSLSCAHNDPCSRYLSLLILNYFPLNSMISLRRSTVIVW
jgi:hypothetical protein